MVDLILQSTFYLECKSKIANLSKWVKRTALSKISKGVILKTADLILVVIFCCY